MKEYTNKRNTQIKNLAVKIVYSKWRYHVPFQTFMIFTLCIASLIYYSWFNCMRCNTSYKNTEKISKFPKKKEEKKMFAPYLLSPHIILLNLMRYPAR